MPITYRASYIYCTFHHILFGRYIKEDEVGGKYGFYGGLEKIMQNVTWTM
jgi:hypothetical protein